MRELRAASSQTTPKKLWNDPGDAAPARRGRLRRLRHSRRHRAVKSAPQRQRSGFFRDLPRARGHPAHGRGADRHLGALRAAAQARAAPQRQCAGAGAVSRQARRPLRRCGDRVCRGVEPVSRTGADPLAILGAGLPRLLQELQPARLLCRARARLCARRTQPHSAGHRRAALGRAVRPVSDHPHRADRHQRQSVPRAAHDGARSGRLGPSAGAVPFAVGDLSCSRPSPSCRSASCAAG